MKKTIDKTLFEWSDTQSRLLGSFCRACSTTQFPQQTSCPACSSTDTEVIPLKTQGHLWSWTTQDFPPSSPPYRTLHDQTFKPFLLGYVELENEVRVQTKILTEQTQLQIGMPLKLTFEPQFIDQHGNEVMMYAFETETESPTE